MDPVPHRGGPLYMPACGTKRALRLACLAFLIQSAYPMLAAHAESGENVRFESAPLQPSEFQKQKAKEAGKALVVPPGIPLEGYLIKPDGSGPFPAVVILHGCDG